MLQHCDVIDAMIPRVRGKARCGEWSTNLVALTSHLEIVSGVSDIVIDLEG